MIARRIPGDGTSQNTDTAACSVNRTVRTPVLISCSRYSMCTHMSLDVGIRTCVCISTAYMHLPLNDTRPWP